MKNIALFSSFTRRFDDYAETIFDLGVLFGEKILLSIVPKSLNVCEHDRDPEQNVFYSLRSWFACIKTELWRNIEFFYIGDANKTKCYPVIYHIYAKIGPRNIKIYKIGA